MPAPDPQQELITRLRAESRLADDALYRARLELERARREERHALEERTLGPAQPAQTADLRAQLAQRERQIAALGARLREADAWLQHQDEQRRLLEHLQHNLDAVDGRRAALQRELEEAQRQQPPSPERVAAIAGELERLESVRAEIAAAIEDMRADAERRRREERQQQERRDEIRAAIERERAAARASQARLEELLRPTFADGEGAKAKRGALEARAGQLKGEVDGKRGALGEAIAGLYREDKHPRTRLSLLDDRTPFLLLPVRLETIFVPVSTPGAAARTELWVRVYPDDVAVHTHEDVLTESEAVAGELYWTELVVAAHLQSERDQRRGAAWRHLVTLFGGHRAAWIARKTRPGDWAALAAAGATQSLPALLRAADAQFFTRLRAHITAAAKRAALDAALAANDGDAFARLAETESWFDRINPVVRQTLTGIPDRGVTKPDAWTRTPRTELLPDRFVLLLYAGADGAPREIVGEPIADTVWLGPDPMDAGSGFVKTADGQRTYGPGFDWMSDFGKAVEQGMGFRVPLSATEARDGFAKVCVLGLSLATTADEGAVLLEQLIDNHQFSAKGFSLVPQGTPTNNTERDVTGYSDNDLYDDLAFYTGDEPPAFDAADPDPRKSRTDGRLLADALGIAHAPLATVRHADRTDALDAGAMNTALFPATLGYWLKNWMAPVIPAGSAREARNFFTRYVSGRGPLPAVRVGNQPYGVLLTSDFSRWKYPQGGMLTVRLPAAQAELGFLRDLHTLLAALEKTWTNRAAQLPFVGKTGSDASEVLMDILGLHASSVEFFQRIGYSAEYLQTLDQFQRKGRYDGEMESLRSSMPPSMQKAFHFLGFETLVPDVRKMGAMHVLWQHYVSALDVPNLVENKPPSETRSLTMDYIDWLAKAAGMQQIKDGHPGANAASSLLYLMLRNALLLQLHHGSFEWLEGRTDFEPALEQSLVPTTMAGVRSAVPSLSKYELMATQVQAAEPAHVSPTTSVADWIWAGPKPAEVEAAFAQEQRRALELLASASTARLERAFVEHLDCCNYRLDAWQTGLFAQRLAGQRAGRPRGVHLGAFGWVENLKPSTKTFIDRQQLPPLLQPVDQNPVIEEDEVVRSADPQHPSGSQGGFVHAPSLGHASAAALLRNAYLSHATPEMADPFAINLSSERVRRAQFILEGMRNGQPIEALLGYQFERGLHDRSSASAASGVALPLEVNQFILPYREVFPYAAVDLTQAGAATPIETVAAHSVVNGLKLSEAALSAANGYGLGALLTAAELPTAEQGAVILAERAALLDTIDAVKDLLMAENAYQLVRGNFDRVAAVSLAQKDANVPNEIEVIDTPRGTQFTFTNRVTLHFAALDPAEAASNPWLPVHMTPRANAEPGMNHWLGGILGPPGDVQCIAYRATVAADGAEIRHDERRITLADLAIQPIDLVWLLNIAAQETGGATELETRVAWHYQRLPGVGSEGQVRIRFNPPVEAPVKSFARVFPLVRHLRALLTENRALEAGDLSPDEGASPGAPATADDNPKGFDVPELRSRVVSALTALGKLVDTLDGPTAPVVQLMLAHDPADAGDDETISGPLGGAFDALDAQKAMFTDAGVTVTIALLDAEDVHRTLRAISLFGIDDAFAPEADLGAAGAGSALLARAHRVARRLRRGAPAGVLDRAAALVGQATADLPLGKQAQLLLEAGKILFGETFNVLPKFTCRNELDLATAAAARPQLLAFANTRAPALSAAQLVEEWLQGLARVRPKLHRWEIVRTLADNLSDVELELLPVQVPHRALDSWLALEFPARDPLDATKPFGISRDTLSIAAHGAAAFKVATPQSGILIDDWTEEIPTDEEITGISFRFNQPNAAPPQAMLLVVTPEETGSWSWDDLVGALSDTLARARRRAVEPGNLEKEGLMWNAVAPALVSEFTTLQDADVSLDQLLMLQYAPLESLYGRLSAKV